MSSRRLWPRARHPTRRWLAKPWKEEDHLPRVQPLCTSQTSRQKKGKNGRAILGLDLIQSPSTNCRLGPKFRELGRTNLNTHCEWARLKGGRFGDVSGHCESLLEGLERRAIFRRSSSKRRCCLLSRGGRKRAQQPLQQSKAREAPRSVMII